MLGYLCCVWLAHPEPYNKLLQPCCIPPSGNESFLALVSGCQCGCGRQRGELTDPVCLWSPAAGADRVEEPRQGYQAPCKEINTHMINMITWQGVTKKVDFVSDVWWNRPVHTVISYRLFKINKSFSVPVKLSASRTANKHHITIFI